MRRALIAAAAALGLVACQPAIKTDNNDRIIDVRNGVRWDVLGMTEQECLDAGGAWADPMCEGIDY